MPGGEQLRELVVQLKSETGHSVRPEVSVDSLDEFRQILRRTQKTLFADYDWPHMRSIFPLIPLNAGEVLYDLPANCDYDRVESVVCWCDGIPYPLIRGIDANMRQWTDRNPFPFRYDFENDGRATQIRVWPEPQEAQATLEITGTRKLRRFMDDGDICDLDGTLIVLFAAAEMLARAKMADAPMKLAAARDRLDRLRARASQNRPPVNFAKREHHPERPRFTIRVV